MLTLISDNPMSSTRKQCAAAAHPSHCTNSGSRNPPSKRILPLSNPYLAMLAFFFSHYSRTATVVIASLALHFGRDKKKKEKNIIQIEFRDSNRRESLFIPFSTLLHSLRYVIVISFGRRRAAQCSFRHPTLDSTTTVCSGQLEALCSHQHQKRRFAFIRKWMDRYSVGWKGKEITAD